MAEAVRLDAQNPWPGLAAFSEDDRNFFRGRERETDELSRLCAPRAANGAVWPLRPWEVVAAGSRDVPGPAGRPAPARLPAHQLWGNCHPATAGLERPGRRLRCRIRRIQAPPPHADESMWGYFHRADAGFWNRRRRPMLPVLVFDQFEELDLVGQADEASRAAARAFIEELSDLVEDRPSETLRRQLDADAARSDAMSFDRRGCKVVMKASAKISWPRSRACADACPRSSATASGCCRWTVPKRAR